MDRQKADAVIRALLEPEQERQRFIADKLAVEAAQLAVRRRRAGWGLAGFAVGALAGHFLFGYGVHLGLVGAFMGMLVHVLIEAGRSLRR